MAGFTHDPLQTINEIANTLRDRYKSGFPVLKEIIQNSDDSGGKPSIILEFGLSKGLCDTAHPLLKGPALFFLNDGNFTAKDDRAIRSFALSSKADDPNSIGKFGLGMKSVFHFCEAFFYLAKGSDSKTYQLVLNPWDGGDDYQCRHPSWNNFVAADQLLLRNHLSSILDPIDQKSDSWFLLWLPLRKKEHLEGSGSIIAQFPGDDPSRLHFLRDPNLSVRLSELLPLLRRLSSIRYWVEGDEGFNQVFHVGLTKDSVRLKGVGEHGIDERKQEHIRGKSGKSTFAGLEQHIVSQTLESIRNSPLWPRSYVRNEDGIEQHIPDKAEGHAAVVFSQLLQHRPGNLRIRWAVFLPLEGDDDKGDEKSFAMVNRPI